jgi:uncharacterized membrane protein YdcZ (DUF606 family)
MNWRCDDNFSSNLDKLTIGLAKGASMGLATYLTIKLISVAHDNKWEYLATGWGAWYAVEMIGGVVLPLFIFANAIRNSKVGLVRFGAVLVVVGVVLNRMNTAMFTFNWKLPEREIPHWREVVISITLYAIYIAVYRFILCRLPILYQWKTADETVPELATGNAYSVQEKAAPAAAGTYRSQAE